MREVEVLNAAAVTVACTLEAAGLQMVADGDCLIVRPRECITPDLDRLIRDHKQELLVLLQLVDDGVIARREQFRAEWLHAYSGERWPRFIFTSGVAYAAYVCFSCGEPNGGGWGRCWRCRLAWRLAVGLPAAVDASLIEHDGAKRLA